MAERERARVIVLDAEDLSSLIEGAVARALERRAGTEPPEWLTPGQAAELLGIHPRSVRQLAARAGLPVHRIGPRMLRYRRDELTTWIANRRERQLRRDVLS